MERLRIVNKVTLGKDNNIRDDTKPILHLHLCTVMFSSLYTLETSAFEESHWKVMVKVKQQIVHTSSKSVLPVVGVTSPETFKKYWIKAFFSLLCDKKQVLPLGDLPVAAALLTV